METNAGTSPPEPNSSTPPPGPEVKKRGRGRPPGSTNKTTPLPETPSSAAGAAAPQAQPQPQKRKRRAAAVDTEKLAKQLKGIHLMFAMITGDPVMQLSDTEAIMLADSLAAVGREYDLAIDGKTGALVQLVGTAAFVYVPRIVHLKVKQKANRKAQGQTIDGVASPADGNASAATSASH